MTGLQGSAIKDGGHVILHASFYLMEKLHWKHFFTDISKHCLHSGTWSYVYEWHRLIAWTVFKHFPNENVYHAQPVPFGTYLQSSLEESIHLEIGQVLKYVGPPRIDLHPLYFENLALFQVYTFFWWRLHISTKHVFHLANRVMPIWWYTVVSHVLSWRIMVTTGCQRMRSTVANHTGDSPSAHDFKYYM